MITQAVGASGYPASIQAPGGKLGKDEFLKILVAQLRNQDPMNPSSPEEFSAQLAQFSSLEQLMQVNQTLTSQAAADAALAQALNNSAAVGVLGRTVLAVGDTVEVSGTGEDRVTVGVGGSGGHATLTLYDEDGNVVGSRDAGELGPGRQVIELKGAADGLPPGRYRYAVTLEDGSGGEVAVQTFTRALIDGVRYGPQGPTLTSGGLEIPLADVVEIIVQTD